MGFVIEAAFLQHDRDFPAVGRALEGASNWARILQSRSNSPRSWLLLGAAIHVGAAALWLPVACLGGRRRAFAAWILLCVQVGRLYGTTGGRIQWVGH